MGERILRGSRLGAVSYESAMFYATNPSEFALRASGIHSASDARLTQSILEASPD